MWSRAPLAFVDTPGTTARQPGEGPDSRYFQKDSYPHVRRRGNADQDANRWPQRLFTLQVQPRAEADYGLSVNRRLGQTRRTWIRWALPALLSAAPGRAEEADANRLAHPVPEPDTAPSITAPSIAAPTATAQSQLRSAAPAPRASSPESVRYVVDAVEVTGNTRTRESVIVRFVPFTRGDILDVDDPRLELTKFRLLGTGFFRDATLSLRKGQEPGHVSLVVHVVERNTIVVNDVWMGLAASADTSGDQSDIASFGGIDAAETNLLGTGITLGVAAAFSADQQGLALRYHDPAFLGGPWMLDGELLRNDGLGFFGNAGVRWDDPNQTDRVRRQAVVSYQRRGVTAGVGRDLGVSTQAWLHLRAERLRATLPRAASHVYGGETEPLQFNINKGTSTLSTLRFSLYRDTRDQPILPTRGMTLNASVDVGLRPVLSDYSYQKVNIDASLHLPLAHSHVLSLFGFVGLIAGNAPFIDQYYVGDLSDFRPGRILGLSFDDRPAPNFLGTAVEETRYGDFAAKVTAEYRIPLYRGSRSVYGVDFFAGGGLFALADHRQFDRPPRNRRGLELLPIDLTASLGLKLDTSLGGFAFSVSNLVGFARNGRPPEEVTDQ